MWFGGNGVSISPGQLFCDFEADVALLRLTNIDTFGIAEFPRFASTKRPLKAAMTMCRLGFPFAAINAHFNEQKNDFEVPPISSLPLFPNDAFLLELR